MRCKKVLKFALVILLLLLQVELALRFTGYIFQSYQERFAHSALTKEGPNVLVLGESTSSDMIAPNEESWPSLLAKSLQKSGIQANIINAAKVGTNTTLILGSLPALVEKYHPAIVISMMGVNDSPNVWRKKEALLSNGNFFHDLRIVKLFYFLRNPSTFEAEIDEKDKLIFPSDLSAANFDEIVFDINHGKKAAALQKIDADLKGKNALDQARFFAKVAMRLMPKETKDPKDFQAAYEFHKKSLEYSLDVYREAQILALAATALNKVEDCKWLMHRFAEEKKIPSDLVAGRLLQCLPANSSEAKELHNTLANIELRENSTELPTGENYRALYKFLKAKKICLIAMQYPLLPLEDLRNFFGAEDKDNNKSLFFVSNQDSFSEAQKRHPDQALFVDHFAGKFGHATALGNELIATGIEPTLTRAIQSKECFAP